MLASQQVIEAAVARLVAHPTVAGARVYSGRFHPVAVFPAIRVAHADENLRADDADDITWPPMRLHSLQLDVQVLVQANTDVDAAMAAGALQVLVALGGVAQPLAPLPVVLQARSVRYQQQTDGSAVSGIATVRFEAQFNTRADAPDTII